MGSCYSTMVVCLALSITTDVSSFSLLGSQALPVAKPTFVYPFHATTGCCGGGSPHPTTTSLCAAFNSRDSDSSFLDAGDLPGDIQEVLLRSSSKQRVADRPPARYWDEVGLSDGGEGQDQGQVRAPTRRTRPATASATSSTSSREFVDVDSDQWEGYEDDLYIRPSMQEEAYARVNSGTRSDRDLLRASYANREQNNVVNTMRSFYNAFFWYGGEFKEGDDLEFAGLHFPDLVNLAVNKLQRQEREMKELREEVDRRTQYQRRQREGQPGWWNDDQYDEGQDRDWDREEEGSPLSGLKDMASRLGGGGGGRSRAQQDRDLVGAWPLEWVAGTTAQEDSNQRPASATVNQRNEVFPDWEYQWVNSPTGDRGAVDPARGDDWFDDDEPAAPAAVATSQAGEGAGPAGTSVEMQEGEGGQEAYDQSAAFRESLVTRQRGLRRQASALNEDLEGVQERIRVLDVSIEMWYRRVNMVRREEAQPGASFRQQRKAAQVVDEGRQRIQQLKELGEELENEARVLERKIGNCQLNIRRIDDELGALS
eukprot:CAMPEP_0113952668 /NCGR_PEP_ID=MMETSP1339-20121228/90554_1 /TAXON_ID=94617 /ORGANISM="Fibrocapsa japonica" /LENGTH=539 /DNA_ID=CAMNT_0000961319 /DNA_START=53 /DNA_END=1672 /DNA_ORIENTATION=- /assembly_acc=CAM_ASM_000762